MEFSIPQDQYKVHVFIAYASVIQDMIKDLSLNGFADDSSLRRPFNPNQTNSGTCQMKTAPLQSLRTQCKI